MDVKIKKKYSPVERAAMMVFVFATTLYVKLQITLAANYNITNTIIKVLKNLRADIIEVSSYAAGVCGGICLLTLMFTKSDRATEISMAWLKRIAICYVGIISIIAIVTFFNQFKITA